MSAARDRLTGGHYNSLPKTVANPGGMDDGGHVANFPAALTDVGVVASEMIDDNAAKLAAVVADNDATQAAIVAVAEAADASAASAAGFRDTASGAADAAAGAATTATNAAVDVKRTVANAFPDRLDATGSWFTEAAAGDPGAVANPTLAAISDVAGYGYEYAKANAQGQLFSKGVVTASSDKVYEVEAEVEWTVKGGAETPSLTVGVQGLDAAFADAGGQAQAALQAVGAIGVVTMKHRFGYAAPAGGAAWPSPGVSIWLRPYVLFNRLLDDSGPVTASTARVRRLTVRDVTAVVQAEVKAAEAAASAASVALASDADAAAGTGAGLMSPPLTAMAISAQAVSVGGVVDFPSLPNANWLPCTGLTYLNTSYPVLAPLMTPYFNPLTTRVTPGPNGVTLGAYGAGIFVVFGHDGADYCTWTSPDAVTWTKRTSPWAGIGHPVALAYGVGGFFAARGNAQYKSADGFNWTAAASTGLSDIKAVTYANDKWVLSGIDGGGVASLMTSADLSAWSTMTGGASGGNYALGMAYSGALGRWVAVGYGGMHWYSNNNAVTWTAASGLGTQGFCLIWHNDRFIAGVSGGRVFTQETGVANGWTEVASGLTGNTNVVFSDGVRVYIATSNGGIARTTDFVTWTKYATGSAASITYLARANAMDTSLVVVAQGSAGIRSGLDASTTQFTTPVISGRAPTLNAYIKAA